MKLQELLDHPKIKRVCVGICVDGRPWDDDHNVACAYENAHAHTEKSDPKRGWICVRSARDILCQNNNNLSRTMMHEFCHLSSGQRFHNDRWRKEMHLFGQPIPKRYQKRKSHAGA